MRQLARQSVPPGGSERSRWFGWNRLHFVQHPSVQVMLTSQLHILFTGSTNRKRVKSTYSGKQSRG